MNNADAGTDEVFDFIMSWASEQGITQSPAPSLPSAERQTVNLVGWMLPNHSNWATFRDLKASALARTTDLASACTVLSEDLSTAATLDNGMVVHGKVLEKFLRQPDDTNAAVKPTEERESWSLCPKGTWPSFYALERNPAVYQKFAHDATYLESFKYHAKIHDTPAGLDSSMQYPAGHSIARTLLYWNRSLRQAFFHSCSSPPAKHRNFATFNAFEEMFLLGHSGTQIAKSLPTQRGYAKRSVVSTDAYLPLLHPYFRLNEQLLRSYYDGRPALLAQALNSDRFKNREETFRVVRPPIYGGPIPEIEVRGD